MWPPDAGVYHYRARAYAPQLGRFLQTDPMGYAAGANLYAYVGADSVNFADPTGLLQQIIGGKTYFVCADVETTTGSMVQQCTQKSADGGGYFDWGAFSWWSQRESIYGGLYRPPNSGTAYDNPQYAAQNAAYQQASNDNWYLAIPILAPEAAVDLAGLVAYAGARGSASLIGRVCNCFEAGTLVHTENGVKPIDQVAIGDRVLSRDEATGETAYKPVLALIAGSERKIWEVMVETINPQGEASRETIGTTDEHPWRLLGGHWAKTAELEPGSQLVSSDGRSAIVISVVATDRVEPTYNFEVEDLHTYFVGEIGLWVHNACGPSGNFMRHFVRFSSRSRAREAAIGRTARGLAPIEHTNPTVGNPHFHPVNAVGEKIPGLHYTYPR